MTAVQPAGVVPATGQDRNGVVLRPLATDRTAADADRPAVKAAVRAMLEARSVALVGASARPATFGRRMLDEVAKSSARPRLYPINPRYAELDGARCYPALADLPESPDLALLAVPDGALEQQLALAAEAGCRGAVIFGNAHEDLRRCWPVGVARPPGRHRALGWHGAVWCRLHGLRERQPWPARDRLHRA